jgi:hypothetical protein
MTPPRYQITWRLIKVSDVLPCVGLHHAEPVTAELGLEICETVYPLCPSCREAVGVLLLRSTTPTPTPAKGWFRLWRTTAL